MPLGTCTLRDWGAGAGSSASSSSARAREEDEKWGRSEGRLREIVDQDVRGRDEGGGKERDRWRSGGLVSFNLGRFCSYVLSMMSSVQTNIEKQTVHA